MACGVEVMSRIPIGITLKETWARQPIPKEYFARLEMTSQFEGAERIADKWEITRDDTDAFGFERSNVLDKPGMKTDSPGSGSRSMRQFLTKKVPPATPLR